VGVCMVDVAACLRIVNEVYCNEVMLIGHEDETSNDFDVILLHNSTMILPP
jgi:hypothetical protein